MSQTRVLLVRGPGYDEASRGLIRNGLQARLGQGVGIDVVYVDRLEPEASGKHRYVVSRVNATGFEQVVEHA